VILLHARVHNSARRFVPLLLLMGTTPLVVWAQSNVPSYAISSSIHYRESGIPDGTGENDGSPVINARALLGKDSNTTVELTTGKLDSSTTPPGSFAYVRLRPLTPSGVALFSQYFRNLARPTGYYSFTWPSLYRGEQIQLRSYVSGFPEDDPVTVYTTVKLRPDLAVQGLTFPETAIVQQTVNIRAHIAELNGDSGATTACVLGIDGNSVDQANNVYVDAGGGVTCEFSYIFSGAGTHSIDVSAANPVPGDWDLSNNTASATITISTDNAEHGFASFVDASAQASTTVTAQAAYQGNTVFNYSKTIGSSAEAQATYSQIVSYGCTGATNATSWQVPVDISYTESMDGTQKIAFTDTGLNAIGTSVAGSFPICNSTAASLVTQNGSTFITDHFDYIGSRQYLDSAGNPLFSLQVVTVERQAGAVTYFSSGYQCSWWKNCSNPADYYAWNTSTQTISGTVLPVGSTWESSIASKDASGNTFAGILTVPLNSSAQAHVQPTACVTSGPDSFGYTYNNCTSANAQTNVTSGITAY